MHGHHHVSGVGPYHKNVVLDIINATGMDETYGAYVDDECFGIHMILIMTALNKGRAKGQGHSDHMHET